MLFPIVNSDRQTSNQTDIEVAVTSIYRQVDRCHLACVVFLWLQSTIIIKMKMNCKEHVDCIRRAINMTGGMQYINTKMCGSQLPIILLL